jgi:tellurite resistance protein TehA-like permease
VKARGQLALTGRISAFAALFAAGALLAVAVVDRGRAADITTTETATTVATTTAPGTTVATTVQETTTVRETVTTSPPTTAESESDESVPTWAWVLIGALALGLVILLALLLVRRGAGAVPPEERRRRLDGAVNSWIAQGWAIESQTPDSAVLRRGNELMLVGVDPAGSVTTRPVAQQ